MPEGPQNVAGSAYIEIRPAIQQAQFESEIGAAVDQAGQSAATKHPITPHANTQVFEKEMEGAFGRMAERFKATLEYSGAYFVSRDIVDQIKDAFTTAVSTDLLESRAKSIFGTASGHVIDFATTQAKALDLTKKEALQGQIEIAQFFKANTNVSDDQALKLAQTFTELSGKAGFLVPSIGGATGAMEAFLRAIETGSARGLRDAGFMFKTADIQAEALAMGLIKPTENTDKLTIATNNVKIAQDELAKANKGTIPTQQQLTDAHLGTEIALTKYHKALAAGPANSLAAAEGLKAYNAAKEHEASLVAKAPDPDKVLRATNNLIAAQDALAKATDGTLPPLDEQTRALATAQLIQDRAGVLNKEYADAQGTTAQAAAQTAISWEETKQKIADRALPKIRDALNGLTNWLDTHQDSFQKAGDGLSMGLGYAKDAIQFISDHATVIKDVAIAIGGLWAIDRVIGFKHSVAATFTDLNGIYNKTIGKWFPNVFGKRLPDEAPTTAPGGGGGAGAAGTTAGQKIQSVSQMNVTEMTVDAMISKGGAGGLTGGGKAGTTAREAEAAAAREAEVIAAAEGSAVVAQSRLGAFKTALSGALVGLGNMIGGAALAAPFVMAMFDFAASKGWIASANPIEAINSSGNRLEQNRSGVYWDPNKKNSMADKLNLTLQGQEGWGGDMGDVAKQALGSQAIRDIVLKDKDSKGLGDIAALLKDQGQDEMAGKYGNLAHAVELGMIKNQDDLNTFLAANGDFNRFQIDMTRKAIKAIDVQQGRNEAAFGTLAVTFDAFWNHINSLPSILYGLGPLHPPGTPASVAPSKERQLKSLDIGGYVDRTGPAYMHEGEFVLTPQMQRDLSSRHQTINVYNPSSEVDVMSAMRRQDWLDNLGARGVQPAGAWPVR